MFCKGTDPGARPSPEFHTPITIKKIHLTSFPHYFCNTTSTSVSFNSNFIATFLIHSRQIITMKKLSFVFCVLVICTTIISCGFPGGSISIKQSEYSHYFEMTAKFNRDKTAAVERLLDKELSGGNMSFANTQIDGDITLDDKSVFSIKKSPGFLHIKLDKEKNSDAVYYRIKSVCEEIKDVVR